MIRKIAGCGLSIFWGGVIAFGYSGVMSAYWQELFSVGNAETGLIITFMLLALAVAMFFSGKVHAKVGMAKCVLIGSALYVPAFGIPMISLCAICVGVGFGTLFTVTGPMASELFGLKNFGMIFGLIFTAYGMVGGIVGPAVSGLLLEKTGGDYAMVFTYLGIMALVGFMLMGCIKVVKIRNQ